jgi:hypothetical protein
VALAAITPSPLCGFCQSALGGQSWKDTHDLTLSSRQLAALVHLPTPLLGFCFCRLDGLSNTRLRLCIAAILARALGETPFAFSAAMPFIPL